MATFVVFIIALVIIVLLFIIKGLEIYHGRKLFLEEWFSQCDTLVLKIWCRIKFWWSHINFKNVRLIFSFIITNIRKGVIALKRRFDHKQSHFFTKRDQDTLKSKGPASFFLKDVSDYKKALRKKKINNV